MTGQGDDGSGLNTTYGFALTSGTCESATYTNQTATTKTYNSGLTAGTTYYGCVKVTDKAGNTGYLRSIGIPFSKATGSDNLYTSSGEYSYVVPVTGEYRLEVWGAQGGGHSNILGGYGGYSKGSITLTKGTTLYINVGGEGSSMTQGSTAGV